MFNRDYRRILGRMQAAPSQRLNVVIASKPIEIPLTKGYTAILDPVDADLAALKWYANTSANRGSSKVYAGRHINRRYFYLHRLIMERVLGRPLLRGEQVDHIDGNKLNNRRSNLRIATPQQNAFNRPRQSNNTSGYKGVYWSKVSQKWVAEIKVNGRFIYLGLHNTPEIAYEAYCRAAQLYANEFAYLDSTK